MSEAAVLHLLLQEVPLAVADKSVAHRRQKGGIHRVGNAGQQRCSLLLLWGHGLDGLLLVFRQQKVARREFDGADRPRLSKAPINTCTFCTNQWPKIRLIQVAGWLGLMIVSTKARLEGQGRAKAVCWLYSSKVLPEGVHRTPTNHLGVQRVHRTMSTVVNTRLQDKKQDTKEVRVQKKLWFLSHNERMWA